MYNEETLRTTLYTLETMRREGTMAGIAIDAMQNDVTTEGEAHDRLYAAKIDIAAAMRCIKSAEKQIEYILVTILNKHV